MDAEYLPVQLSTVVIGLGYINLAISFQELINKNNQPLWKKVWQLIQAKVESEDLWHIALMVWALFPISTIQNLRILWIIILTELLVRRLKNKFSFFEGSAEDICRVVLMWITLYSNVSSLQDIWLVWFIVLVEFIYRRMKLRLPPIKGFTRTIFSLLPSRMFLSHGVNLDPANNTEKKVLAELKCPMCTKVMKPPITMCGNGHNICSKCKPKLFNCPICRGTLLNLRNIALEKVAESYHART